METVHLEIDDVDEFIPELAEKLKIGYENELGEKTLNIPKSHGTGTVTGINFPNGIGLYTYNCKFSKDFCLSIKYTHFQPLRLIYSMEGELENTFSKWSESIKINHHQHLIYAPLQGENHHFIFQNGEEYKISYLEIDRFKFQEYISFNLSEADPVFYNIFSDTKGKKRISQVGKFSLRTAEVIKEIKNCEVEGFPRINFIGAKSLEILSYMLSRFQTAQRAFLNKNLKEKDLETIDEVVDYIDDHIAKTGTVQDLARQVGTNTNKLQEGFQAIYGKTVNEYIRDVRLTKALQMLSSGKKNVSEVVYELGLSSRSYFSKIFKEKYGVSPRKVLMGTNADEVSSGKK